MLKTALLSGAVFGLLSCLTNDASAGHHHKRHQAGHHGHHVGCRGVSAAPAATLVRRSTYVPTRSYYAGSNVYRANAYRSSIPRASYYPGSMGYGRLPNSSLYRSGYRGYPASGISIGVGRGLGVTPGFGFGPGLGARPGIGYGPGFGFGPRPGFGW